jgi:hypothetical protein
LPYSNCSAPWQIKQIVPGKLALLQPQFTMADKTDSFGGSLPFSNCSAPWQIKQVSFEQKKKELQSASKSHKEQPTSEKENNS